jgi:hypothetical protein
LDIGIDRITLGDVRRARLEAGEVQQIREADAGPLRATHATGRQPRRTARLRLVGRAAGPRALEHRLGRERPQLLQLRERELERAIDEARDAQHVLRRVEIRREQVVPDEHPVRRRHVEVVHLGRNAAGQRPRGVGLEPLHFLGEHRLVRHGAGRIGRRRRLGERIGNPRAGGSERGQAGELREELPTGGARRLRWKNGTSGVGHGLLQVVLPLLLVMLWHPAFLPRAGSLRLAAHARARKQASAKCARVAPIASQPPNRYSFPDRSRGKVGACRAGRAQGLICL